MQNSALAAAGVSQARPWEEALSDYLSQKGYLSTQERAFSP
jgi:hypothetical protein